ncbi:MAG: type 1 glutamine amidotransferase [Gammaproteobacteria bacterium]|nr:MAG: type 1 glutamine amidotransferase [Gammaproteobacteria bacterium]
MKPIRFFRHVACESPGYIGTMLEREGVPCDLVCLDEGVSVPPDPGEVAGLVIMGGPGNVNEPTGWMQQEMEVIRRAADQDVPVLGICLGAQLISKALGGEVYRCDSLEVGWHEVERIADVSGQGWFDGLPSRFEVFQWHEHTFSLPHGAVALARSACAEHQAFEIGNMLAMQFHLEMTPESITGLVERYPGDLKDVSDCVQSAETITADLAVRTRRLYRIADAVFGRWVAMIKDRKAI